MSRKERVVHPVQVAEQARSVLTGLQHRDIDAKKATEVARQLDPVRGANWQRCLSPTAALQMDDAVQNICEQVAAIMVIALDPDSWVVPPALQRSRDQEAARKAEEQQRQQKAQEAVAEYRAGQAAKREAYREKVKESRLRRHGTQFNPMSGS